MSEILSFQSHPSSSQAVRGMEARSSAVESAAMEWLETQAHVVGYWRDLLISEGADDQMIAALDRHADFLRWVGLRRTD